MTGYGYKKDRALESRNEDHKDGGSKVDSHASDPTKDGQDLNIYYFHEKKPVDPTKDPDKIKDPSFDPKELTKIFTRTIIYRGTKDNGQTYQDVDGSPDGTHVYNQKTTFTRKVFVDQVTGKVTGYTDWQSENPTMSPVESKNPADVDYQSVDIPEVGSQDIDPNSDQTDLGKTIVTYTSQLNSDKNIKYTVTVHYVDEHGNVIKDPVSDGTDYKDGSDYDTTDHKPTEIKRDGKVYTFEKIDPKDSSETGKIPGKDVDVTYVYKLDDSKTKIYNTTVKYVDEHGHELIPSVPGQQKLHTGDRFDNSNKKKDTIIPPDGTKYVLVPEKSINVNGQIADHDEVTVYVYKPVVPSGGSVIPGGNQPGTPSAPTPDKTPEKTTPKEKTGKEKKQEKKYVKKSKSKKSKTRETSVKKTLKFLSKQTKTVAKKRVTKKTADYYNNNMPHSENVTVPNRSGIAPLAQSVLNDGKNNNVSPKGESVNALGESSASTQNEETGQLPQTGEKNNSASIAGFFGLAGAGKKRKH